MAIMELNRDKRKNYLVNFDHNCDRNFYYYYCYFDRVFNTHL